MGNSKSLTSIDAKNIIKNMDLILDVRSLNEWNEGHHPNAKHIPLDQLEQKFKKKYSNKDIQVLIYCKSGNRANKAWEILTSQGYTRIYYLSEDSYQSLL